MIEAGTVGAVFSIRDDASQVLQRLADEFNRLQGTIDAVKKSMAEIGGAEDGPLAKLREQFELVGKSGEDASRALPNLSARLTAQLTARSAESTR